MRIKSKGAHSTILAIAVLNKCQLLIVFVVVIVNFTIKSITKNMNSVHVRLFKSLFFKGKGLKQCCPIKLSVMMEMFSFCTNY